MKKELAREASGFYLSSHCEVRWIAQSVLNISQLRTDGTLSSWLLYLRNVTNFHTVSYLDAIMNDMRKHGRYLIQYFWQWEDLTGFWQPYCVIDHFTVVCSVTWPLNGSKAVNKVKSDHHSKFSNLSNWKWEAWKTQGFNRIRTRDHRDTGAMLYQLSYEATRWERDQFIEFIFSCAVKWREVYMK